MQRFRTDLARIGDVLDHHATEYPERIAVEGVTGVLTYGQLAVEVEKCARALLAEGLRPGDRIAVLSSPRPEVMVTFLAAAKLGILWLGLNPKYQMRELEYVIADSRPQMIFGIEELEGRNFCEVVTSLRGTFPDIRLAVGFDDAPCYDAFFSVWLQEASVGVTENEYEAVTKAVDATAPALLVYTSGSSGNPKGVLLRQRELLRRSQTQNEQFPVHPYPKLLNPLPINHIGGMHFLSLFAFVGGGTVIYAEKFVAEDFISALATKQVNILIVLPTMLQIIVRSTNFSLTLLDDIQWLIYSGAALPREIVDLLFAASCEVGLTYGLTETCGSVTYAKKDGTNKDVMTRTIGRSTPSGEVRLMKPDGKICQKGDTGEIQVRAEYCMGGYLNRPEATADAFTSDGWLRTGDIALQWDEGNIEFIGRMSEMFKSGGYNVYPREIELVLETHPDVELSAVVGVPDELFNEVGWAYVIARADSTLSADALKAYCATRLANYKLPKRFFLCDRLPMLPVGKVDKMELKKIAAST